MADIDFQALEMLIGELDAIPLTGKTASDKQKEVRLLAKIACVRSGMPLRDVQRQELNNYENEHSMPVTRFERPMSEKMEEARHFAHFIRTNQVLEQRDSTVGNNPNGPQFLSGNVGNSLVARTWLDGVQAGRKWFDPIFGDICRQIETESGNPMQCGFMSDVNSVAAVVVPENSNQAANEQDPVEVGAVDIGAWSYRTPMWRMSYETLSDLQGMTTALELFQRFSSDRIARGAGANLMTGTGSNQPLGLITSLQLLGTGGTVIAAGSSESTGGSQTGANSVGYSDLVNLATSLDPTYAASPSTCWLCNFSTFSSINRIIDKQGRPLRLITWQDGRYYLLGSPLYISPSVPSIGAGNVPLLYGDFSYFAVRHARAGDKVSIIREAAGLIEKGEFGMRSWTRLDCALLFGSTSTPPPIVYLTNHS
jgi:HK97 family phage major capsid protein